MPNQNDVIASRFLLKQPLGQGAFGSVWLAHDRQLDRSVVVKLLPKSLRSDLLADYAAHLDRLQKGLSVAGLQDVSVPIEFGETDEYLYQVSPYIEGLLSLAQVLAASGAFSPSRALNILVHLSTALAHIHERGFIHADLKPANVLVSQEPVPTVRIIDFGMVRSVEADDSVLVFGTYLYLHPDLVASTGATDATTAVRFQARAAAIGPYIDIYALGVMGLELLTRDPSVPRPLSQGAIAARLHHQNPWLRSVDEAKVGALANLLFQLLAVRAGHVTLSAQAVASIANSLLLVFSEAPSAAPARTEASAAEAATERNSVSDSLRTLERLGRQLSEATAAFVVKGGTVHTISNATEDERILAEVTAVFENAVRRARTSWRLGVAITLISFALLVSMIVAALTLTIVTGHAHWAVVFGGVGVTTVIGTLIWRPFDRLYTATVLTQQIEMIHVQTVAGFRGTTNVERRMRLCREAVAALKTVVQKTERRQRTGEHS